VYQSSQHTHFRVEEIPKSYNNVLYTNNVKFLLQETLTGFKWMGNLASDLMAQGKTVLFSFEEAIGEK